MANSLGTAAHALDTTVATLQTQLATYLAAGGSARLFASWLNQSMANADASHVAALSEAYVKAKPPRPSPGSVQGALAAITPGAVYP